MSSAREEGIALLPFFRLPFTHLNIYFYTFTHLYLHSRGHLNVKWAREGMALPFFRLPFTVPLAFTLAPTDHQLHRVTNI